MPPLWTWGAIISIAAAGCAKIGDVRSGVDGAPAGGPSAGDAGGGAGGTTAPPQSAPDARGTASDAPTACVNLQCQQMPCTGGQPTSLSGTAYAPNGTLPMFNVMVYVPNAPLEPFKAGVTCDRCGVVASGHPLATAVSDAQGRFTIKNVPAGKNIPLVVQVGKWRRKTVIPNVAACQDNAITDANLTRLPRNRTEGDIPKIAVATGECDQLGCLFAKIGVDASEFGVAGDDKAIIYYKDPSGGGEAIAGPPNMRNTTELWNSETTLRQYDMTMLSCECGENPDTKTAAALGAMASYIIWRRAGGSLAVTTRTSGFGTAPTPAFPRPPPSR